MYATESRPKVRIRLVRVNKDAPKVVPVRQHYRSLPERIQAVDYTQLFFDFLHGKER